MKISKTEENYLKAIHQESINHQMEVTKPEIIKK